MAIVHDFLDMWQGSQTLHATHRESHAPNKQMTAVGYISDPEVIINASCTHCHHDGAAAAFKSSERSPQQLASSAKDRFGRRTQTLNVHRIKKIDPHLRESDEDSAPKSISNTENRLICNCHLATPNLQEHSWVADIESDLEQDNVLADRETSAQGDVSKVPNVPGLIWTSRR